MKSKVFFLRILLMILISSLVASCNTPSPMQPPTFPSTLSYTTAPPSTQTPAAPAVSTPTSTHIPPSTNTPTVTATSTPSRTATPVSEDQVVKCPGAPDILLKLDDWAQVSLDPPLPNKIRSQPGTSSETIGRMQPGENVLVVDGPRCADGYTWWFVRSLDGMEGWTAEGDAVGYYWLVPPLVDNAPALILGYTPGQGMVKLGNKSPYELTILPGGWQAYQIGLSANEWGYLVDITPLQRAVDGAYVEYKILPEYFAGKWVDTLWLRAPGILDSLPVRLDLIPTKGWKLTYEANVQLTPGDWMGFAMFPNGEGSGGVLDISPVDTDQVNQGAYIENTRVQPEFPGNWMQVIRVSLSKGAVSQPASLRYYSPGPLTQEVLRQEASLSPGVWSGWVVGESQVNQGYVVEVIPLKNSDNEVALSIVQPEFNGNIWQDVLRIYVPEGRPVLEALLRVLAVPVQ